MQAGGDNEFAGLDFAGLESDRPTSGMNLHDWKAISLYTYL